MKITKLGSLLCALPLMAAAGASHAYDCSNLSAYSGGSVSTGQQLAHNGHAYRCDVGGWCSQGGAYEPGVGWAWDDAWTDLGVCDGSTSSSSSSVSSSSSSVSSVSSSISSSSSSTAGGSCGGLPVWASQGVYRGGDQVQYQNTKYEAQWWTQGDNPTQSGSWGVWDNLGACGGSNSSSSVPSSSSSSSSSSSTPGGGGMRVVGYAPSWSTNANAIDYSRLTHINYSFVLPNPDGTVQAVPNPGLLQSIVNNSHANGVKVLIAVGGWNDGDDSAFVSLANSASGRTTFVNAMMSIVDQYNLDGVDVDWEYPDPGSEADNYTLLMEQLGSALRARGKLLTAAVVAQGYTGGGVQSAVFDDVDFLNLMAYDGGNGATHSPYSYAVDSLSYWTGRGLAADKAVLGVPFYARPSWSSYATKVSQNAANACRDTDGTDYWNGIPTIRDKAELARSYGGIMTWELSQDTTGSNSLLRAMYEAVNGLPGTYNCN